MNKEHTHKWQMEGTGWACFGWEDACGLRAPACFRPNPDVAEFTKKGLIDLVIGDMVGHDPFTAEHFAVITIGD